MSKQQELDGEALPVKEGFPKNQSPLLLNSIPSLPPPHSLPTPFLSPQYKTTPWCWWTQALPEIQENLIVCRCCAVTQQYLLFWWILSQCEAREAGASLNTMRQPSPPPTGGGKSVLSFSHPPWPCLGNRWSRTITPVPWPLTHSMTWVRRRKKKKKSSFSPSLLPNAAWEYSGTVILSSTLFRLLHSIMHPAACGGGMEMIASCCERCPLPTRGRVGGQGVKMLLESLCFPGMALGPQRALGRFEVFSQPTSDAEIWLEHMLQANRVHLCLLKMRSPADWV